MPVAEHQNKIYVLLGKDAKKKWWSGFGGHRDWFKNKERWETILTAAVREWEEESIITMKLRESPTAVASQLAAEPKVL